MNDLQTQDEREESKTSQNNGKVIARGERNRIQFQLWEILVGTVLLALPLALVASQKKGADIGLIIWAAAPLEGFILIGFGLGYFFIHRYRLESPKDRMNGWVLGVYFCAVIAGCLPLSLLFSWLLVKHIHKAPGIVILFLAGVSILFWGMIFAAILSLRQQLKQWLN